MIDHLSYLGLPDCIRISNGTVELIVATGIGPRILRYGFIGGENILGELPPGDAERAERDAWKPWGGHRLWAAPEARPRTYAPDNEPVEAELLDELSVHLKGKPDASGLAKEMIVELDAEGSGAAIAHVITNENIWGIDLAPWALTIMNGGGTTILPQEPYRSHSDELLPARSLALWGYTDLTDPRWTIGARYIRLRTDAGRHEPQKIGLMNKQEWGAYHRERTLFIKRFPYLDGAIYPDYGCNVETYTAGTFMELESLAPMHHLEPHDAAEHRERWSLHQDVTIGESEEEIGRVIDPLLESLEW